MHVDKLAVAERAEQLWQFSAVAINVPKSWYCLALLRCYDVSCGLRACFLDDTFTLMTVMTAFLKSFSFS